MQKSGVNVCFRALGFYLRDKGMAQNSGHANGRNRRNSAIQPGPPGRVLMPHRGPLAQGGGNWFKCCVGRVASWTSSGACRRASDDCMRRLLIRSVLAVLALAIL